MDGPSFAFLNEDIFDLLFMEVVKEEWNFKKY